MKIFSHIVLLLVFLVGCQSERVVELIEIRDAPITLRIRTTVLRVLPDTKEGTYQIEAMVLSPEKYSGKKLILLVDGVPRNSNFLQVDKEWTIDFDEFSFSSIETVGVSAWNYNELNPRKMVEPVAGGDATR